MKFIHLSDLHIGKRLKEYDLSEEIDYALKQIEDIVSDENPDGILIAGDIYDKSNPSENALKVFDNFICRLVKNGNKIYMISGNHDSAERISYCSELLKKNGIFAAPKFDGLTRHFTLCDEYGDVEIYLLPYFCLTEAKKIFNDDSIKNYTEAMIKTIKNMNVDERKRNILVAHQFVSGALMSDSENIIVGGTDNVNASIFAPFDYVALGHLHRPQYVFRETIRYCGTPVKYSVSEAYDNKSVTVVELAENKNVKIRTVPLKMKRDIKILEKSYDELMNRDFYRYLNKDDFYSIILTDKLDVPYAMQHLRDNYHNILDIKYKEIAKTGECIYYGVSKTEGISTLEIFSEFYSHVMNSDMNNEQRVYCEKIINEIWG